jgi:hypothetical protein
MRHLATLLRSRPFLSRVPDQSLVYSQGPESSNAERIRATRDAASTYAFIYFPEGEPAVIDTAKLPGERYRAAWFDPRVGVAHRIVGPVKKGRELFEPPSHGEGQDWILLLDDESKNYSLPYE